ncbi:MAG: porin family protein [Chromatiales bacterium]|nr:porin family protein [Chromatiales bacterium]
MAPTLETTSAKFRVTYEEATLPGDELMGFTGGTYLYTISDYVSVGPAFYGALTGERGGFITLGGATEAHLPLGDSYELNSGLFIGAGGGRGGYTLSGGGLMLRYHAGVKYKSDRYGHFGLGMSYLDFPDGAIHSGQPYLSYEYPFRTLIGSGWISGNESPGPLLSDSSHQEIAAIYKTYTIPAGVLADNGAPQYKRIDLVGGEWNKYINKRLFLHTEGEGAMGGKSQGYMQILLGAGYRQPLGSSSAIKLIGSAGYAGGGNVATGGGFIVDAQLSFQQAITDHLYLEATAGHMRAPDTNFQTDSLALKLGYQFATPYVDNRQHTFDTSELTAFTPSHFRARATHQSYLKADPNWRGHHNDLNIDNMGLQLDAFINRNLFLTGQGIAAYRGEAGAYMTGLLGAGLHLPMGDSPLFLDGELLTGAAGGGGADVNGGFVWQYNVGAGYQLNDHLSLIAQYGRMEAPNGNFKANVVTLSLGYNFTLFTR